MEDIYLKIKELAKKYEELNTETLIDLVKTPSHSNKEKQVIQLIKEKMLENGFDEVKIDGLGNVIGRIGNGKRIIAFDAHIDTVYPGEMSLWKSNPFDAKIINNEVYGRGSVDQKSGMAAMIIAGKIIQELKLNKHFTIYFTGTVNEEDCDGQCWQYLINEEKIIPELVIITEPTNLNIYRGQRGRMEIEISIRGLSCHGSAPERGDNAIYKMAKIVTELEKLNEKLAQDSFLGKGTLVVSEFKSSGPSQCAVPDFANIYIDRRLTKGEDKNLAIKEIRNICNKLGFYDIQISVPFYNEASYTGNIYPVEKYYPTWVLEEDSQYLKFAEVVYNKLFNKKPLIDKWTFSTNGVAIAGLNNIPCIGFGPGDEKYAHAPNEACPIEHLTIASSFYAAFIKNINEEEIL